MSVSRLIATSTAVKLCMDTTVQFLSPFLSIVAAGLGADVVAMGRLVSLRSIMGLLAPAFGIYADRSGYRRTIRLALTLAAAGMFILGIASSLWVAALGMIIMGLGTGSFVPVLQSYLSGRLPYSLRARGLGIVEYSWALTGIVSLSVMGWIIAATNWRVPILLLAGLLLVAGWVVSRLPPTQHTHGAPASLAPDGRVDAPARSPAQRVRAYFALGANTRSTYATIFAGTLIYFAGNQMMILWGAWLDDAFQLGASTLGTVALVLGIFDLVASVIVSLYVDSFGKKRSVIVGAVVALAGFLAMPSMTGNLTLAVLGIALARMGFEFAIVSYFPLLSEQTPHARGKVMSLGSAILVGLSTTAGLTAPWLYVGWGISAVAWLSAAALVLSLVILLTAVHEPQGPAPVAP